MSVQNGFASGPVEFEGFVVQADSKTAKNGRSGSPGTGQRGRGRNSRLPGLGASPKNGERQGTPYQADQAAMLSGGRRPTPRHQTGEGSLNGPRRPSPRRGGRGTGFKQRGSNNNNGNAAPAAKEAPAPPTSEGWTVGSEAPGTVTSAKLSPRKSSAGPPSPKAGSDISPPDSPPKEDAGTKSLGSGIQDTSAQRAELEELKLELEEAKSAVSKAEAEKDLAGVQTQVMQQEFEMESRRMAREQQILQDELDETKARVRAVQEENERKIREKDRYIQLLWRTLEVHNVVGPLAPSDANVAAVIEREEEPWASPAALRKRLDEIVKARAGGESGKLLVSDFVSDVPVACGLPAFWGRRLRAHAICAEHGSSDGRQETSGEKSMVSVEAFMEFWKKRLYPLSQARQYHRLLCHCGSRTEAITMTSLQPFIEDSLAALPQLSSGTPLADETARRRVSTVLAQRIMHFCCRTSVRRMSRLDFDSSDLEDVLDLLAQEGDLSGQDKVTAFFAVEEAEQVVQCFDKIDPDSDGKLQVADVLNSRNAATDEEGGGLVPRCGTFTLSQAAIEGVFACCADGDNMDLGNFARLFHAYVYPHAPSATRFWFDVIDTDQDGKIRVENFELFLQEQVFILNTHLESQGEQPVFVMENLMAQV